MSDEFDTETLDEEFCPHTGKLKKRRITRRLAQRVAGRMGWGDRVDAIACFFQWVRRGFYVALLLMVLGGAWWGYNKITAITEAPGRAMESLKEKTANGWVTVKCGWNPWCDTPAEAAEKKAQHAPALPATPQIEEEVEAENIPVPDVSEIEAPPEPEVAIEPVPEGATAPEALLEEEGGGLIPEKWKFWKD